MGVDREAMKMAAGQLSQATAEQAVSHDRARSLRVLEDFSAKEKLGWDLCRHDFKSECYGEPEPKDLQMMHGHRQSCRVCGPGAAGSASPGFHKVEPCVGQARHAREN